MIDQRVSEGETLIYLINLNTTTLPAQLAIKFKMDIIPVYIERKENNNFEIQFEERVNPEDFKDKIELSKKLNYILKK